MGRSAGRTFEIRIHDLRHVAASTMLGSGVGVPAVVRVLCHACNSTMLDLYGHAVPANLSNAVVALQRAIQGAQPIPTRLTRRPMAKKQQQPSAAPPDPVLDATLEQLEGSDWGDPVNPRDAPTTLIRRCLTLRRQPLRSLTVEDLRMLIGQRIGLEYLVPLALVQLGGDPLAEGDFYAGDLLYSVLGVASEYWQAHPERRQLLEAVCDEALTRLDPNYSTDASIPRRMDRFIGS